MDAGTSGSTALATQNTGIANLGGGSGAGGMALLPQMNAQAVTYALPIPNAGNSVTYPRGVSEGGSGYDIGYMKNNSDPMRDVLGSGRNSNPAEWNSIIQDLEKNGVEIKYREGEMAYAPGLTDGSPGQLVIDPDASLSALKHEYQHFLDAQAEGFPSLGKQLFEDPKARVIKELRAYMVEIKEADRLGFKEVSKQLFENYRQEREWIINQYIMVGGE